MFGKKLYFILELLLESGLLLLVVVVGLEVSFVRTLFSIFRSRRRDLRWGLDSSSCFRFSNSLMDGNRIDQSF